MGNTQTLTGCDAGGRQYRFNAKRVHYSVRCWEARDRDIMHPTPGSKHIVLQRSLFDVCTQGVAVYVICVTIVPESRKPSHRVKYHNMTLHASFDILFLELLFLFGVWSRLGGTHGLYSYFRVVLPCYCLARHSMMQYVSVERCSRCFRQWPTTRHAQKQVGRQGANGTRRGQGLCFSR